MKTAHDLAFHVPAMQALRPRLAGPDKAEGVESYFFRANHPQKPQAFWLKATLLRRPGGPELAELWCMVFERGKKVWGAKASYEVKDIRLGGWPLVIEFPQAHFEIGEKHGTCRGEIQGDDGQICQFELQFRNGDAYAQDAMYLLPHHRLLEAKLPKNKLITPHANLNFQGRLKLGGQDWEIDGWRGIHGHNWGQRHSPEYAWAHCHFLDPKDQRPFCSVEAFSGRIALGPFQSPLISSMVIYHRDGYHRFDQIAALWKQSPTLDFPIYTLEMRGPDGHAQLEIEAKINEMACLGYENPNGERSFCLNSKLARATVRMNPFNGHGFEYTSPHGGALEFLTSEKPTAFTEVI